MSLFGFFKDSPAKKGAQIADFIISLGAENTFKQVLETASYPMSMRLIMDYILVYSGTALFALNLGKRSDDSKNIFGGMVNGLVVHLERMSERGVKAAVKDMIVDDNERKLFLQDGWNLDEVTDIYTLFEVVGDHRMNKYSKALIEGYIESTKQSDSALLTTKLMQATKNSCGGTGYPYAELKLIHTRNINRIITMCHGR